MKTSKIILGLFVLTVVGLLIPSTAFCQTEKLGILQFTPPKDWKKNENGNVVVFSDTNQTTGGYCFITLYGATTGTGNPQKDFVNEWKNRVVEPFKGEASPKTETEANDDWTAIAGGSAIEFQGNKSVAFLTVYSRDKVTFSVLGITNDEKYLPQLVAFVSGIKEDKNTALTNNTTKTQTPTYDANGHLIIPPPTRQLTVADFAGEWGQNDGITTNYVDRYTGDHIATDSYHYTNKMTLTAEGGYYNDFFGIKNGRKIMQKTNGTFAVTGRVLTIAVNGGNTDHYLIRGWVELPDITIFEISGSLEVSQIQEYLANPDKGWNLNQKWVRKK